VLSAAILGDELVLNLAVGDDSIPTPYTTIRSGGLIYWTDI